MAALWPRLQRRWRGRRPRPAILMYHRIAEVRRDPWELAVPPELFARQMDCLRRQRTVFSMDALVEALAAGTLPSDAVAVTFDDGYRDNLLHALPVLARFAIPATVFLPTGLLGRQQPLWWDRLATLVLESPATAKSFLPLPSGSLPLHWNAPEAGDHNLRWRGWQTPSTDRQRAFVAIWGALKALSEADRDAALEMLTQSLPTVPVEERDDSAHLLGPGELGLLQAGGWITLGAHTVSHASLPGQQPAAQRHEVDDSMAACARLSYSPVRGFAYPFGDCDQASRDAVQAAGCHWACTTEVDFLDTPAREGRTIDLLRLPRLGVTADSLQHFERRLQG